ncbi:MAG TPA: PfkB family carbohydrate kinase [Solirubrobacterales bacterium]|nr:PfkB family carbohydrate kinase [Solirubrobacterales bacterium]
MDPSTPPPSLSIFAPSPILTVTIEPGAGTPEVHFHAGGQGVWVARMAAGLGARVTLCTSLGGESGEVLRSLLAAGGIEVLAAATDRPNAAYLHDRRGGERTVLVETPSPVLERHELDDLFGIAVTSGLSADVTLLTGERQDGVLPTETYGRIAEDLRSNGRTVLADLARGPLAAALAGGLDVAKVSDEELCAYGRASGDTTEELAQAMRAIREEGADVVLVSRAGDPALLLRGNRLIEVEGPRLHAVEPHGAGDAMFGALGVCLGAGVEIDEAVRYAVAAGAVNVMRHGLGSGRAEEIERLLPQVHLHPSAVDVRLSTDGDPSLRL